LLTPGLLLQDLEAKQREWEAAQREQGVRTGGLDVTDQGPAESGDLIQELDGENFWESIRAAEGLVVVDFFTKNCGPCKQMYPRLVEMARELKGDGVVFRKMECRASNKAIGKALKVRVAPTFVLFRGGERVGFMTGAHADELLELIRFKL